MILLLRDFGLSHLAPRELTKQHEQKNYTRTLHPGHPVQQEIE